MWDGWNSCKTSVSCTSVVFACVWGNHGLKLTCSTPLSSDDSPHEKPPSRTALREHRADSGALITPRQDDKKGCTEISHLGPVGRRQRRPQIPCHCSGPCTRRTGLVQPGGAGSGLLLLCWISGSTQHVQHHNAVSPTRWFIAAKSKPAVVYNYRTRLSK